MSEGDFKVQDLLNKDRKSKRVASIDDDAKGSLGFPHIEAFVDADLSTDFVDDRLHEISTWLEGNKGLKNKQAADKMNAMYDEVRGLLNEFVQIKRGLSGDGEKK